MKVVLEHYAEGTGGEGEKAEMEGGASAANLISRYTRVHMRTRMRMHTHTRTHTLIYLSIVLHTRTHTLIYLSIVLASQKIIVLTGAVGVHNNYLYTTY